MITAIILCKAHDNPEEYKSIPMVTIGTGIPQSIPKIEYPFLNTSYVLFCVRDFRNSFIILRRELKLDFNIFLKPRLVLPDGS